MNGMDILFLLVPISILLSLSFVFYMFYQMFMSGHGPFTFIQQKIIPKIRPLLPSICLYQKVGSALLVGCIGLVFSRLFPVNSIPDIILFIGMAIGMFMVMITTYLRVLVYFFS